MIEPFEVGVSIALGDGVLEAVGKAHRDLAQLQAGLKSAGPSVQQLRQMARRAVGLTTPAEAVERRVERVAMSGRASAQEKPPVVPRDAAQAGADVDHDHAPSVPQITMPLRVSVMPPLVSAVRAMESGLRQVTTPLPGVMPRETGGRLAAPLGSRERSLPDAEAFRAIAASALTKPSLRGPLPLGEPASMPHTGTIRHTPAAVTTAPSAPAEQRSTAMAQWAAPVIPPVAAAPAGRERSFVSSQSVAPRAGLEQARCDGPVPGATARRPPSSLEVRAAIASTQMTNADTAAGADRTAQSAALPSPAQGQMATQQLGGDVMLDGMMVGKWLSRHLNRQAMRAASGPTAFDARRGRLLPGATVGA